LPTDTPPHTTVQRAERPAQIVRRVASDAQEDRRPARFPDLRRDGIAVGIEDPIGPLGLAEVGQFVAGG
jgi:hypothetical protein